MQATKLVINVSSGQLEPIGPGQFVEKLRRTIHAPVQTSFDDEVPLSLIEMGSFQDEDCLKFRKRVLKLKEIFDVELLTEEREHRQYRDAAITHFCIQELHKFSKNLKTSVEVNGDLHVQDIDDLAIEFLKECGSDGHLVWMKNSVLIVSPEDFEVHLGEINKVHKKSRMMCGALFCSKPSKVVKATYTGKVRLV